MICTVNKDGTEINRVVGELDVVRTIYPEPEYEVIAVIPNEDITRERDERVRVGGVFSVSGYGPIRILGDETTTQNLQGSAMGAQARMATGDVTTLRPWKDADNIIHQLTPPQMFELWSLKSDYVSDVFEASWALKALDPIPSDYGEDIHWPAKPVQ